MNLGLAGRLEEAGEQRLGLLGEPASTPARPLLDAWLVLPDAATLPFVRRAGLDGMTLADLLER